MTARTPIERAAEAVTRLSNLAQWMPPEEYARAVFESIDREGLAEVILANFHGPDQKHSTWWINTEEMTDAIRAWLLSEGGV